MAIYKGFSPNLQSAFSIVMMIAIWIVFAPAQVGGMASYIIVIGKSMEPKFHKGDLVIVHKQPVYQVGDAIVYRNLELKSFVFHRIVSQAMGHFTLKGDNNAWLDTYKPSHEEIIGKLWVHIPRGGIAVQNMRSPWAMALIAGILGAFLAANVFMKKTKGNKGMNDKSLREWLSSIQQKMQTWTARNDHSESQKTFNVGQGEILEGSFFVLGLLALSSLILAIISFSRPTSRTVQDDINYQHLGVFSYSASTPHGVYDADTIKSGDPIFTKLICTVDVNFQYTLVAAQTENISGTYQLTAIISDPINGWQRVLPLQEASAFTGTAMGTTSKLDFCKMEALAQSMEEKTASHSGSYTLMVRPNIKLDGEVSGRKLESTFNPALTFRYDHVQFYLVQNEEQNNPMAVTEAAILREEKQEANTLLIFGKEIAIPSLRLISLSTLLGSLSGLVLIGLRVQNLSRLNQEKFFRIKYDSVMIDVQNESPFTSSHMIDVSSMEALAKLAERFNAMILHTKQGNLHAYYLQAGGTTYRFIISVNKIDSTVSDPMGEAIL